MTRRDTASPIFETHYRDYLRQIGEIDPAPRAPILDVTVEAGRIVIPFFQEPHRLSREGIVTASGVRPPYDVCVALARYVLNCPARLPVEDDWTSFRDFKDAGPLTVFFRSSVEGRIAEAYTGRWADLREAARKLGGHPPLVDLDYDVTMQFVALPRVPMLLLFNDADEEFPAQCAILFERRADRFLDAESLAVLGAILAQRLVSP